MVRDKPLHNFFFEFDEKKLFDELDCWSTPWIDLCVILHLIRFYTPRTFLEIGTHWGYTTRAIATRFPEMEIVTVDPGDKIAMSDRPDNQVGEFLEQSEIGKLVEGVNNVKLIKEPFLDVDFKNQKFEMIFIDGNHNLPHVLNDSHRALELLAMKGVIIWHDYNNVPDVNKALDQLNLAGEIVSLHNTWIAYYDSH